MAAGSSRLLLPLPETHGRRSSSGVLIERLIIMMCLRTEDDVVKYSTAGDWVDGLGEVAWRHVAQEAMRQHTQSELDPLMYFEPV